MFHRSVNSKTIMTFNHHHRTRVSTMTIAAVALLFAADPVLGNQKVLAANLCGSGLGCGDNPDYGISYPSHSHTFSGWGGDVLHFHHFHGGFGFHHFGHFGHFGFHHH